ncbi:CoA pyrophosphatase [Parahaliea sp. F7430]|uniref:CoA pyrophosphatase n=1 Tax=Sediminihaliea albiluteola TaxID=2758564 RepID=A0A7W2TXH4_9GAMM|nr:CoA pyrophosphatase [Sediminihaliea albiluteola]MBA6413742.1 CoA pyrophosphatase [Sediminihaliea albiluteola]
MRASELLAALAQRFPPRVAAWQGQGRQAGVLVALTDESQPQVVLGRRALHLPLHPGEVAFPGGKREPQDRSIWDTALRESHEEVALPPSQVNALAQLPPLQTRSSYQVHPCVGLIPPEQPLMADPAEFDSVFTLPLLQFAERDSFRLELMGYQGSEVYVPHYEIADVLVWGVTATVLAQIVNVVYDAGLDLKRA